MKAIFSIFQSASVIDETLANSKCELITPRYQQQQHGGAIVVTQHKSNVCTKVSQCHDHERCNYETDS